MAVTPAADGGSSGTAVTPASRYSLVNQALGKGGMGTVELATRREGRFLRVYAIKRLSEALRDTESGRAMFMDEARIAGLLRHPNVVSVLDVGEDERGPYLVMDYVKGLDLAAILRGLRARGRHMPVDIVMRILADAAAGLHAAHELRGTHGEPLGLVHRDVSPHNVLVDFEGTVRLTDFGIAKAGGQIGRTSTGALKGKLEYMAPEQLRFEPVDRRSDLFALGAVAFELLTRKRLFAGESQNEVARAVLAGDVPDLAEYREDIPPALHELLLEMLATDPERRPRTASEVKRRLEGILRDWSAEHGDPRELSEFLVESFEEHRAQIETLYAAVLAEAERPNSGGARVIADPVGLHVASPKARRAGRGSRRMLIALGVTAAIVVVVALVALGRELGGSSAAPSEVRDAPTAPHTAPSPVDPAPQEHEAEHAEIEAEPEARETSAEAPPERRPRPRRGRAGMRAAMTSRGGAGVDGIWLPGMASSP